MARQKKNIKTESSGSQDITAGKAAMIRRMSAQYGWGRDVKGGQEADPSGGRTAGNGAACGRRL